MAEEEKKPSILTGFNKVLEILANKISKKAALTALAMVLICILALNPIVTKLITVMVVVAGLAVFGVVLQFVIDYINAGNRKKRKKDQEKE